MKFEVGDIIRFNDGNYLDTYRERILSITNEKYFYIILKSDWKHEINGRRSDPIHFLLDKMELDPEYVINKQFNKDLNDLIEDNKS